MSQTHDEPGRDASSPTPGWVKALVISAVVLILLFGILHLTGNSPMGPGSHLPPTEHRLPAP